MLLSAVLRTGVQGDQERSGPIRPLNNVPLAPRPALEVAFPSLLAFVFSVAAHVILFIPRGY